MSKSIVRYTIDDEKIALIEMVDEAGRNALSAALVDQLIAAFDRAEKDGAHVVMLAGMREVFSAGAERDTLQALAEGEIHVKDLLVSERIINAPMPTVATIEGHAIGGGLVMAACCDIVVAAKESRYGAVFMNMGFTPGMGCTLLLELLFGAPIAHEMMYTGKRFRGSELAKRGAQLNRIIPKEEVRAQAYDIAQQIAEKNSKSVLLLKYTLAARKKKILVDARLQEDLMHRVSFAYPETKSIINEFYHHSNG